MLPVVKVIDFLCVSFKNLSFEEIPRRNCIPSETYLLLFPPQICTYLATIQHMMTSIWWCAVPAIRSSSRRSSSRTAVSGLLHLVDAWAANDPGLPAGWPCVCFSPRLWWVHWSGAAASAHRGPGRSSVLSLTGSFLSEQTGEKACSMPR